MEVEGSRKRPSSHRQRHRGKHVGESGSGESGSSGSEEISSSDEAGRLVKRKRGSRGEGEGHSSSKRKRKRRREKEKVSVELISKADYYIKSVEFRAWLSDERDVFFSDLSSQESRKLFLKFVQKWNKGALKKKYYKGKIQSSSLQHSGQTQYKWKFADGMDTRQLESVRDDVSSWTSASEQLAHKAPAPPRLIGPVLGPAMPPAGQSVGPSDAHVRELEREDGAERVRRERREMRRHHEMVMDELLPKATGREAAIEKKRIRSQQRREREASPDVKDSLLMGAGGDIKKRIEERQQSRQKRAHKAVQRISDYQAREKARMAAILESARANKKEGSLW